jgi:CheY-like chemotaxis protein
MSESTLEPSRTSILLVDDSESFLLVTADYLKEAGFRVSRHVSAKEALRAASSSHFDLIITDIYMPDKDGLEFISEARGAFPGVPVVAMSSAKGARDLTAVARKMGAVATLKKPFTKEDLLLAVSTALDPARVV